MKLTQTTLFSALVLGITSIAASAQDASTSKKLNPADFSGASIAMGERRLSPPGVFYMLDRVSVETETGVHAVVPGDEVKLLERKPDRLRLTDGTVNFEAPLDKVTNDLDLAQEAVKRDVTRHSQRRSLTSVQPLAQR